MPSLKGTSTEQNLKDAFAGESQANRRYLYFAQKADVEGTTMFPLSSVLPPKERRATPMAIWSISRSQVIQPRVSPLEQPLKI